MYPTLLDIVCRNMEKCSRHSSPTTYEITGEQLLE